MRITLIMAYYDNPTMLIQQVKNIAMYSEEIRHKLDVIIIDDCSPRWPAIDALKSPALSEFIKNVNIRLYRTKVDVAWNQDFCRNLGAYAAKTDWLLLTDIDHLVPESTIKAAFEINCKTFVVYKFQRINAPDYSPYKPHPNSWLMSAEFYRRIGGYDERFAGWYGSDGDFRDRVAKHAAIEEIQAPLIRVPREVIPDASTTTLTRKSEEHSRNIQRIKMERGVSYSPILLSFDYEEIPL